MGSSPIAGARPTGSAGNAVCAVRNSLIPVVAALSAAFLPGCALFDAPTQSASSGLSLSRLTNWVSQSIETAPGFDLESIRPAPRAAAVAPGNLLEITIWDLDEPGRPSTWPVRVSNRQAIDAPLVGQVSVAGRTIGEVETALADAYRAGEYLVQPRVLVRSLDAPVVKIHVAGAVQRPGFAELSREDTSVYAALVAAGGLKKTAGGQVAVSRRAAVNGQGIAPLTAESSPADKTASAPLIRPAAQRANAADPISVGHQDVSDPMAAMSHTEATSPGSGHGAGDKIEIQTSWYDLTRPSDREAVQQLQLIEGDVVTVKSATPPVRIGGVVERPGAYPLPPGRSLNVWQAIDQAGGVRAPDVPLNITLMRPAGEGHGARRWFLSVPSYGKHADESPLLEPGDVLHVEPTTGSKLKRVVGDLWNKP